MASMNMTNMNIRTGKDNKQAVEKVFEEHGLNMTTAINIFLHQNIRENEIPFDLKLSVPASVPTPGLWPVPVWQACWQPFSVVPPLFGFCSASASRMVRNMAAVTSFPGFSPLCLENKSASDNIDFNADMHYNAEEVTVGLSSYLHFIRL